MNPDFEQSLLSFLKEAGYNSDQINSLTYDNPLKNSMFKTLISTGLKALETVAINSTDWKLTAIVKLLQTWIKEKEEDSEINNYWR
jgi:hypothetical protein